MKTKDFLDLLAAHTEKPLLFEYATGMLVGTNYHITEIKHTTVDSVDCGAGTDSWKETIVQLWESPSEFGKANYMSTHKALEILSRVGSIKSYEPTAEIRIEYGNATFHTAQLYIQDYEIRNENLILKLQVAKTDCKAKEACGIPLETVASQNSCAPGSGCC